MSITVNSMAIKYFKFSGGECQVQLSHIPITSETHVVAYLRNSDDIMCLLLAIDAIRHMCADTDIDLSIPYFPYARQDRVCQAGEAFSAAVMANLINQLNCKTVTVYDPHSSVIANLINNCRIVSQLDILRNSPVIDAMRQRNLVLLAPDAGAAEKTREIADKLNITAIYCRKKRDPETGQILETILPASVTGQKFLIVDDICDGGATFIELAKALKQAGASDLYLYVTHGLFSKGLTQLKDHYRHVYCYHSFLSKDGIDPAFLTILKG